MSYRGTAYHGWQIQKNAIGVQQVINNSLAQLLRENVQTFGSGRTDRGVHAEQQYFHVDIAQKVNRVDLQYKLNKLLPEDISVRNIYQVSENSHARFDAVERKYEYRITRIKYPFGADLFYRFSPSLDLDKMNQAAKLLVGEKSFESFSRVKTDVEHFICNITGAYWEIKGTKTTFHIYANRFLRGMVRAIVGTLLEVGQDRLKVSEIERIISSHDRSQAGMSVPAHGLYLCQVNYAKNLLMTGSNG